MVNDSVPRGPGLFRLRPADGTPLVTNIRRIAGREVTPGQRLIAAATVLLGLLGAGFLYVSLNAQYRYVLDVKHVSAPAMIEAAGLDAGMVIFSLLALGLAHAGQPARTERALILACALASAGMNYAAADTTSLRGLAVYVMPPVFLAIVVDRVVAVVRRWVVGDAERSAWAGLGRGLLAGAWLLARVLLYGLRLVLAPPSTARGLRYWVLNCAPVPAGLAAASPRPAGVAAAAAVPAITAGPGRARPGRARGETKKAELLRLYASHPDYGDRAKVSRVAAELAPRAGLQAGTARSYLYAAADEALSGTETSA